MFTVDQVETALKGGRSLPGVYQTPAGERVRGNRMSVLPRNMQDERLLRQLGFRVVEAQVISGGGGRKLGRPCQVVVFQS